MEKKTIMMAHLTKSYLRNKLQEVSLVAAFSALSVVARMLTIPLYPSLITLDLTDALTYVPVSLISFPLSFTFVLINTMTAPNPFLSFWPWIATVPLVSLLSKVVEKYRVWTPLIGPYICCMIIHSSVIHIITGIPLPLVWSLQSVRATANFITVLILSPLIWKSLKRVGLLSV